MPTYFGNETGTSESPVGGVILIWMPYTGTFTCPGSGNQTIKELSVKAYSPGNVRLGIYNVAGTIKIAEGTAEVALTGSTPSWQGHLSQASISPNPATLVGGTTYKIACAFDNSGSNVAYGSVVYNTNYKSEDDTGGLPAALPTPDGQVGLDALVRCGVDPAETPGASEKIWVNLAGRFR